MFYASIASVLFFRIKTFEGLETGILIFFFAAILLSKKSEVAYAFANPMIIEFMLGFFLYRIISNGVLLEKRTSILVLIGVLPAVIAIELSGAIPLTGALYRPVAWGLPAFLMTWAAISLESVTPPSKSLALLGDASYSLYLTHGFVSPVFVFFWVSAELFQVVPWWIYLPVYFAICQSIGLAAHLYIEKPLNTLIRKTFRTRNKCVTA